MSPKWQQGNAVEAGADTRGWIVGHFIDPAQGPRSTDDLEVKWGVHPPGDTRPDWIADEERTTLVILIAGQFRIELDDQVVTLSRQGDYLTWGPGIGHSWHAVDASTVLTVRWPSLPGTGRSSDGEH